MGVVNHCEFGSGLVVGEVDVDSKKKKKGVYC